VPLRSQKSRNRKVTVLNSPDHIAEAKRRLMGTGLTEAQIATWLAQVEARAGRITLTFDGSCFAEYSPKVIESTGY